MKTVYIVSFLPGIERLVQDKLRDKVELVFIKVDLTNFKVFSCPKLDDSALAQKIEYAFIDLPVLAKYRKQLTALKWAHTGWNGADFLTKTLEKTEPPPSFTLTRTLGNVNATLISEYIIGYVLAVERKILVYKDAQDKSMWQTIGGAPPAWRHLSDVTIGILGVGAIGSQVAETCKKLGMTVWGLTRSVHPEKSRDNVDVYKTPAELAEFLRGCDYLCNILPSTEETRYLLSGDVLQVCQEKKPTLINVGRGDIVDEGTLVKAITNGWLGGAVLDVFEDEPLPASSALWTLPGVIITPHVSGWSVGPEYFQGVSGCFVDNVNRLLEGRPLLGALDWEKGY